MPFREEFFDKFIISEKLKYVLNMFTFRMLSKKIILNHTLPCLGEGLEISWTKGRSLEEINSVNDQIGNILGFYKL